MNSFSASTTPGERGAPEGKTSTDFTDITVEGMAGVLTGEICGIIDDLGGVLIKTSTLATIDVGLVTTSGRAGSTTSVGEVGLATTFSFAIGRIGSTGEITGISLTDVVGNEVGSVTTVPSSL